MYKCIDFTFGHKIFRSMSKLSNKTAVVTGGSTGIGLAAAKRLVAEGAYVFITGRRKAELEQATKEIGRNVSAVQGDVSNLDDLDRLYATVKAERGSLDILVINAGIGEMQTLATATPEHFDKIFTVNVRGTFFTAQKALPLLREGGSIVLVASIAGIKGMPFFTVYSATKAAMRSFARSWAAELKDRRIRVNALSPGPVDTPIIDAQVKTREEADGLRVQFASMVPMGRIAHADEMAAAINFLASDESSYCTGIELIADGGMTQI
jgi:NAD(P)-dependent dehydrogenase (short-subunit alcohol dehydrogenase family)